LIACSVEAQIAAIPDDIAYNNHDIDDGIGADLFALEDLRQIDLVREVIDVVGRIEGAGAPIRRVHEMMRWLMSTMVDDVLAETTRRLGEADASSPDAVRAAWQSMVDFSENVRPQIAVLRAFLFEHMYYHSHVRHDRETAARIVRGLFAHYMDHVELLPDEWRAGLEPSDISARAASPISSPA